MTGRSQMKTPSDNPCANCGICCLAFSIPPFDANELVRASGELMRQIDDYASSARSRESNPCLWLDLASAECKHHEVRPVLCRWFEPAGPACNKLRIAAGLPGL